MPKNNELETREQEVKFGNVQLNLLSHVEDGAYLDTMVSCKSNNVICAIAGQDIDNFIREINELIEKYRI